VTVNAYGIHQNITIPLIFKVFKPQGTLKPGEIYATKIELASMRLEELVELGFKIQRVLADSLYGEANSFLRTLDKLEIPWIVAIRKNHGVWMPSSQRVRANKWCQFQRTFSSQKSETRYIREIVYGKRSQRTYWQITTDPKRMPENSTSFVMTNLQEKRSQLKKKLGDLYGLRPWIEYGFRQCKQELGWTDYRLTSFSAIEKWWEIIFCAYLMVSLKTPAFESLSSSSSPQARSDELEHERIPHPQWNSRGGWKNTLNNFRLIVQPTMVLWLLFPWLEVFPDSSLLLGLHDLIYSVNQLSLAPLSG